MFLQDVHKLNLKRHGSVGGALCFPFFVPPVGCVVSSVNARTMWRGVEALVTSFLGKCGVRWAAFRLECIFKDSVRGQCVACHEGVAGDCWMAVDVKCDV